MKKLEFRNFIKEEIKSILKENLTNAKKGRRFIPQITTLPIDVKNQFKEHFKLLKGGDGEYKLYISPMFKASLEQINRGRTGQDYFKKTPELVKKITDKIPQDIKGLLKKYSGNKINTSINMYPVNTKIKDVDSNGDIIFFNPNNPKLSDIAYDPIISEEVVDRIYHLEGILTTDNERNLQAILSDVRSIPGVTTIDHKETNQITGSKYFRAVVKAKVDPYPYAKEGTFGVEDILKEIEISMRQVKGVISFKRTAKPYSSEI
jgi:hypothetical protein